MNFTNYIPEIFYDEMFDAHLKVREGYSKFKIRIDTNDIATYEADCKTITVWPSGGAMSEP